MKLLGKGRLFPLQATLSEVLAHKHSWSNCVWFSPFHPQIFIVWANKFWFFYFFPLPCITSPFVVMFVLFFIFYFLSNLNEDIKVAQKTLLLRGTRPSVTSLLFIVAVPQKVDCRKRKKKRKSGALLCFFFVCFLGRRAWDETHTSQNVRYFCFGLLLLHGTRPVTSCLRLLRFHDAVVKRLQRKKKKKTPKLTKKKKNVLLLRFSFCRECLHLFFCFFFPCHCVL